MQRRIGRGQIISLLLCVAANVLSIWGYVLWCTQTGLDYKEIMDRAFDLGWFGSLYLWSLFCLMIQMIKPSWSEKRVVMRTVMKHPHVLFYLLGILFKLLQGAHFVLPAAQDILLVSDIGFTIGFLIDMYFLILCVVELLFKQRVLHLWSIGMIVLYVALLLFYVIMGNVSMHLLFEILAHIMWYAMFVAVCLSRQEQSVTEKADTIE